MFVVFTLGFAGIFARLVLLQVKDASAYQELAKEQRVREVALPAERGSVLDRNLRELAISLPAKAIYADPRFVTRAASTARVVASSLDLSFRDVLEALRDRERRFVYLARGVDLATAGALEARALPGIGFLDESRRHYPAGDLASQVLGFVGVDGTGLEGLEREYQATLAGRPGRHVVEAGPDGTLIPQASMREVPPEPGKDLVLTLDSEIQYWAQKSLAEAVEANEAKGGSVLVMHPATRDILAMANFPTFDPNRFERARSGRVRNRAVTDVYEPGSVNKVITAAAAIEERVVRLDQRLPVPDSYRLYDKIFHDAHPHRTERMTLTDIIAVSSNVGAIKVARMLGQDRFARYLRSFGFGQRTGVRFPGESPGILSPPEDWWGTSMGTIPIGQGIAVTALQMANVYATIAAGGVWRQPRLVRGITDSDGGFSPAPLGKTRRVVTPATARTVARILAYAVRAGTGEEAEIPSFWVAGKTGTARKPRTDARGYADSYVASFIGFVPASRPALVVAAVLDEPSTVFGGVAAAPLFREVARFALSRLRIAPAPRPQAPPHAPPGQLG